jgi:hypothetical protein
MLKTAYNKLTLPSRLKRDVMQIIKGGFMRAFHLIFFVIISVFVACLYSDVIQGNDTLFYNKDLAFSPHSITSNSWQGTIGHAGLVYTCTTSIAQLDLFVAEELLGTCTYICHTLAVGSPRPFYLSKNVFDTSCLSATVDVDDTTHFIKSIAIITYLILHSVVCSRMLI